MEARIVHCIMPGCAFYAVDSSAYCPSHKCPVYGCRETYFFALGGYCINHKCCAFQCADKRESGYDYCERHLIF